MTARRPCRLVSPTSILKTIERGTMYSCKHMHHAVQHKSKIQTRFNAALKEACPSRSLTKAVNL